MADLILALIFLFPVYIVLIWTYFHPEESMIFGNRWWYKDEPEFSEEAIRFTKFVSIIGIYVLTLILASKIFEGIVILILGLGLFIYIIFVGYKMLMKYIE